MEFSVRKPFKALVRKPSMETFSLGGGGVDTAISSLERDLHAVCQVVKGILS